MAKRRGGEQLREVIIDAAESLVAEDVASVTVRRVLHAAGVSSGTLFHYFGSVDELLLEVAVREGRRQLGTFGDLSGGLDAVLARLFAPDRRDTVLPFLRQRAASSPQLAAGLRRYDAEVNELYVLALQSRADDLGLRDGVDLAAAVEVVRALAEGFQLRQASDTLLVDPTRFVAAVSAVIARTWLAR